MKLLKYEIEKLLKNKLFLILFIGLAVGSLAAFVWAQLSVINSEGYGEEKLAVQYKEDYNSALAQINSFDAQSAVEELEHQKKLYEMCMTIGSILSGNQGSMEQQSALSGLKMQDEEAYDDAMAVFEKSIDFREKTALSELMLQNLKYTKSYRTFIDEMETRAEHQLSFSVFSDNDAFSEANIKKTFNDFESLKGTQFKVGNYLFAEHGTSHFITDVMAMAVMLLLCIFLFMQEREKGLLLLVKSCRNGHSLTAASKLLTLGIFTVITVVIFYGAELVASGIIYGLPDLNAPVQSMQSFMDCSMKISILQYIILFLLSKLLTLLTTAFLLSVIFNIFRSNTLVWLVSLMVYGTEYALYLFVPQDSGFNHPHFINLFYFLDTKTLIADYENLNFFSSPVNIITVYIFLCAVLLLLSSVITIAAFSLRSQIASKNILSSFIEKAKTRFLSVNGSTSILLHEIYKRLIHDKGLIVLAVLLTLAVQASYKTISYKYDSIADASYYAYLERLEGKLTPPKEEFIEKEQQHFDDLQNEFSQLESKTTKTPEENSRMAGIDTILKGKYKGFQKLKEHYAYLQKQHEKNGTEIWFVNEKKYSSLLTDPNGTVYRLALIVLAMALLAGNIFSIEYKRNMKRLLRAAPLGKSRLFSAKYITALLCGVVCYVFVYAPVLICFLNNFHTIQGDAPISSIHQFSELSGGITIAGYLVLIAMLHFSLALLIAAFICSLSELTRNYFITLLLSVVALLLVFILILSSSEARLYSLLGSGRTAELVIGTVTALAIAVGMTALSHRSYIYDKRGK